MPASRSGSSVALGLSLRTWGTAWTSYPCTCTVSGSGERWSELFSTACSGTGVGGSAPGMARERTESRSLDALLRWAGFCLAAPLGPLPFMSLGALPMVSLVLSRLDLRVVESMDLRLAVSRVLRWKSPLIVLLVVAGGAEEDLAGVVPRRRMVRVGIPVGERGRAV
ncbi:hypothetical protein C8Q76DRAFT_738755 [Earliella scabrosa]|nr:hypothetical protein C8Q76DRAFT_738755 [Earliella scabrosa]